MGVEIIIKHPVDKFSKRLWKVFSTTFYIYLIALLIPVFNINGEIIIYSICWILILIFMTTTYYSYRKWALNAIQLITITEDTFRLEFFNKDIKKTYDINKNNIKTTLKWEGSRPRVLKLSVFDNDIKVIDLYSAGKSDNEYLLEDIAFRIRNKINA